MANTTIKITQLPNIGNALGANTLLPVVNTAGAAITEKVTVGNVANYILTEAGNTLPAAFVSQLTLDVVNASQPNITSVGNLTGLTITNLSNFNLPGGENGYFLQTDGEGNLSWSAGGGGGGNGSPGGANTQIQFNDSGDFGGSSSLTWSSGNLRTSGVVAGNVYTDNYYYANGAPFGGGNANTGNIGFTGNAVYCLSGVIVENADLSHGATSALLLPSNGNTSVPAQLTNTYGNIVMTAGADPDHLYSWVFTKTGNLSSTGNIIAGRIAAEGGNLSNIQGSNVSGAVSYASTANSVAVANVVGIGNIATLALNGSSSNVLYGNGQWAAIPTPATPSEIANGTSNVNIPTSSGAVEVTAGTQHWAFGTDGTLTAPNDSQIVPAGNNFNLYTYGVNGAVQFFTDVTGNNHTWTFDGYGYTQLPFSQGYSNTAVIATNGAGNIMLQAGAGPTQNFLFGSDGNLTLPTNTSSINYANGQPYGGGGGNTANVSFNDFIVQGRVGYGLGLAPTPDDTANLKYLQVRAGDIDSHIHFDTGNYQAYDQYFGDDNKYLKLEKGLAGNVLIGTYQDGGIGQLHWTFDSNGNLVLPENGRIKAAGNVLPFSTTITDITSGSTTVIITTTDNIFPEEYTGQVTISNVNAPSQANGTWWYLAVYNNQFQLYHDQALTAPVDGTSWPGYAGGGDAVSVGSAMTINASNITIDTGLGNSWTFDTKGDISFPQGSASFTKGRIQSANGYPTLLAYGSSPEHGGPELDWMNGDNPNDLGNSSVLRNTLFINENGFYVGMNENSFDLANNFKGSWRFGSSGSLTIPAGDANNIVSGQIFSDNESSFINLDVQFDSNVLGGVRLGTSATKPVDIVTGNGIGYNTWRFDSSGEITTPDGTLIGNVEGSGTFGFYNANATDFLIEGPNNVTWSFNTGTANTAMPGNVTVGTGNAGVLLQTNTDGFSIDANITGITNGNPTVVVTLNNVEFPGPVSGSVRITGVLGETEANGFWGWQAVDVNVIQLFTDSTLSTPVDGTTWNAYTGGGHAISSGYNNLDIIGGNVAIQSGAGKYWSFNPDGGFVPPTMTIDLHNGGNQQAQLLQLGNPNYQAVITGPTPALNTNAERLIIQGQRGNGTGEGGDVYFWAGDADTNGGDIKIYAGDADSISTGQGGYINIEAGSGFDSGGDINIRAGQSQNSAGAPTNIYGGYGATNGGGVTLTGGYGGTGNGGTVSITGGQSGAGLPGYGNVLVQAGASTWTFDNGGNLTVPGEGIIQSIDDTVILRSVDANSNIYSARLGTNGGLYFETTAYPTGWLSLTNNSGNANITAATGTAGGAGKHIIINAGDADQSDFYTSAGGNINIKGGLGAFNDGGGGGPGGSINITAGNSSDPAGVSGNINITSGPNVWSFNNVGQLVAIGDVGNSIPNLVIGGGSEPFISSDLTGGPGNLGLISNYLNLSGYTGAKISMYADDGEIAGDSNLVLTSNNTGTTNSWTFDTTGNLTVPGSIVYSSNISTALGFTLSTLNDIGGQVDYNNRTMGYVADNNGTASLYARDSAGLGNHNAVITANGASGTALIRTSNEALTNYDWTYGSAGTLTLPTISLGSGVDEQAVVQSQRKVIPPYRYSAVIDGATPTVVYTAKQDSMTLKTTLVVQHTGAVSGFEMFDVSAISAGANVMYSVSNRLNATEEPDTTVVVDYDGTQLAITLTVNSGATTSYVTYDSTEYGIAID